MVWAMEITACPVCGSKNIGIGTLGDGIISGLSSWNEVCKNWGYQGASLIFESESEYKKFLGPTILAILILILGISGILESLTLSGRRQATFYVDPRTGATVFDLGDGTQYSPDGKPKARVFS